MYNQHPVSYTHLDVYKRQSKHPSFKVLALCFLMMIGVSLIAEGFHFEIPKGYIYFSMAFAFLVDVIQMKTVPKNATKQN